MMSPSLDDLAAALDARYYARHHFESLVAPTQRSATYWAGVDSGAWLTEQGFHAIELGLSYLADDRLDAWCAFVDRAIALAKPPELFEFGVVGWPTYLVGWLHELAADSAQGALAAAVYSHRQHLTDAWCDAIELVWNAHGLNTAIRERALMRGAMSWLGCGGHDKEKLGWLLGAVKGHKGWPLAVGQALRHEDTTVRTHKRLRKLGFEITREDRVHAAIRLTEELFESSQGRIARAAPLIIEADQPGLDIARAYLDKAPSPHSEHLRCVANAAVGWLLAMKNAENDAYDKLPAAADDALAHELMFPDGDSHALVTEALALLPEARRRAIYDGALSEHVAVQTVAAVLNEDRSQERARGIWRELVRAIGRDRVTIGDAMEVALASDANAVEHAASHLDKASVKAAGVLCQFLSSQADSAEAARAVADVAVHHKSKRLREQARKLVQTFHEGALLSLPPDVRDQVVTPPALASQLLPFVTRAGDWQDADGERHRITPSSFGTLDLPTGRIVIVDPCGDIKGKSPLDATVPPGKYRVGAVESDAETVAAVLWLTDAVPTAFEPARAGNEPAAVRTDSSHIAILDAEDGAAFDEWIQEAGDVTDRVLSGTIPSPDTCYGGMAIVMCDHDGGFPIYVGKSRGKPCCIVIDFGKIEG